jgi:hypothetical protein
MQTSRFLSPVVLTPASGAGALPGFRVTCSCGTILRSSLRTLVEHEARGHLAWHERKNGQFWTATPSGQIALTINNPKWKRGDGSDRIGNHMYAESIYERQVGDVLQVIERLKPRGNETQDMRPFYRLVEVVNGEAKVAQGNAFVDTQRDARNLADKRMGR